MKNKPLVVLSDAAIKMFLCDIFKFPKKEEHICYLFFFFCLSLKKKNVMFTYFNSTIKLETRDPVM